MYLEVRESGVEPNTPVDETIGAIESSILMQTTEVLYNSFVATLEK